MVGLGTMNSYVNKNIAAICPNHYDDNSINHCAHFVSHVLGITVGATCLTIVHGTGAKGSIRVDEVFAACPVVGEWASKPRHLTQGLIFLTDPKNVQVGRKVMEKVLNKHVGIFVGGTAWHYSKANRKVVRVPVAQFGRIYPNVKNGLFYGKFP